MKSPEPDDDERRERLFFKEAHTKASFISYRNAMWTCPRRSTVNLLEDLDSVSVSVVLSGVEIAHVMSLGKGRFAKLCTSAWQTQEC